MNAIGGRPDEILRIRIEEKAFQEGYAILRGIALDVRRGEFVSLMGRTGAGKSTLLRTIAGLDKDFVGEVQIDAPHAGGSARCGMVFQESRLLPWLSVSGNIGFGLPSSLAKQQRREAVEEMLSLVGLQSSGAMLPHEISGGMQRRVALARALVSRPEILLLDEPFSALDIATKRQMHDLLLEICSTLGLTTVMVTHDIEEAVLLSTRIIILGGASDLAQLTVISLPSKQPRDRTTRQFVEEVAHVSSSVERIILGRGEYRSEKLSEE